MKLSEMKAKLKEIKDEYTTLIANKITRIRDVIKKDEEKTAKEIEKLKSELAIRTRLRNHDLEKGTSRLLSELNEETKDL